MRVAKLVEPKNIQIVDEVKSIDLKDDEIYIKVKTAGICGTDLHLFQGNRSGLEFPRVMGHEFAGVIDEVGKGVSNFKPGDRVVVDPVVSCGECYACKKERNNICTSVSCLGVQVDGCYKDYFVSPAKSVHLIPDGVSWEEAALIEPYTVAAQAVSKGNIEKGDNVVIIGSGTIGLCILEICKLKGANVLMSDVVDNRLAKARELGADFTVNVNNEDIKEAVNKFTDNIGAEVVIDAVGHPKLFEDAVTLTAQGARVVILGFHDAPAQIPESVITKNELEIKGSRMNLNKFPQVIEWMEDKKLNPQSLITAKYDFNDMQKGFEDILADPNGFVKVILEY